MREKKIVGIAERMEEKEKEIVREAEVVIVKVKIEEMEEIVVVEVAVQELQMIGYRKIAYYHILVSICQNLT